MFEVVLLGSGSARSRARPLASRTAGGDLRPLLVLYTGHSLLIDMDGNIRPPMQRGSSRKPIRRRFAPGSAGMGDFPERFYCSAVESSRQCTHPAANSCRAGGRITSDNIPLSETIPSSDWLDSPALSCSDHIPLRLFVRFRSEGRPLSTSKRTFPRRINSSEMCQNVWLRRALQDGVSRPTNVRAAS